MSDTDAMELKRQLLSLIGEARAEQEAFIAELGPDERVEVGTPDNWSAKDLVAHVSAWWGRQGHRLAMVARGEQPETFDWSDEENAETFAVNRERTWEAVVAEAAVNNATLMAAVAALDPADLMDPSRVIAMKGTALWRLVLGNGYLHPRMHLAGHLVQRGQIERATKMHEQIAEMLPRLRPELRGMALYDLGCFYALTGRPTEALSRLDQAFRITPTLVEYSRQDHDLDALRSLPGFQELYPQ
ncbi:MAG TPA: DinB family protein [Ktedonobacterales bacterium]